MTTAAFASTFAARPRHVPSKESALECSQNGDSASKQVFEKLVSSEEGHWDNFDTMEMHLEKFGEQFLALQSIERSKSMGGGGHPGA